MGSKYAYVKVDLIPRETKLVKNKKQVKFALQSFRQRLRSGVFIGNFEQVSQIFLAFSLLNLNK